MNNTNAADECWRLFYAIRGLAYAKAVLAPTANTPLDVLNYVAGLDVAVEVLADRGAQLADALRDALPFEDEAAGLTADACRVDAEGDL